MRGDHGGQAGRIQFARARWTVRLSLAGCSGSIRIVRFFSGRLTGSAGFQMNITVMQAVAMNGDRMLVKNVAYVAVTDVVTEGVIKIVT